MARVKGSKELKEMVVLYVEDDDSIRESFEPFLKRAAKELIIAKNGQEGVDLYKKNLDKIDIIVSDIKMPVKDGLGMSREIKAINPEIKIVLITAFGDSKYLQESIKIGVDAYFLKPIDINLVFAKLNQLAKSIVYKNEANEYLHMMQVVLDEQIEAVLVVDSNNKVKIYNKSYKNLCRQKSVNLLNALDFFMDDFEDKEYGKKLDDDWLKEKRCVLKQKSTGKYFQTIVKKVDSYTMVSLTDISDYKAESEKLRLEISIDKLTKLYNRKILDSVYKKYLDSKVYLAIIDIDNFKKINDTFGHLAGDEVLVTLANILKNSLRKNDLIIRWGGEEFVIVFDGIKNDNLAFVITDSLRETIENTTVDVVGNFTCSFGLASMIIRKKEDFDVLFKKADELLYRAKRNGKNRVEMDKE